MELDIDGATEASDGDSGLGRAQQHDSPALLPALSPVQQADCTLSPSEAARDCSSVVSSDAGPTPYQLPSGSSVRATIWAPAGFKQPTYRSVQFCPPSPGEAAALQQARVQALQLSKSSDDSDRSCRHGSSNDSVAAAAAVVAASPSPPWRFSAAAEMTADAAAVLPKSADDKLPPPASFAPAAARGQPSGAPWAACQTTLPVFEEITSATAPISESTQPSYEDAAVRRNASVTRGYRNDVSAHGIASVPQDGVASGSRRSSSSSISAAEACGSEDYRRSSSIVTHDAGDHQQVTPHHQKSAVPPAVAPKPSKGVRLFVAQQHREAESHTESAEATERGEGSSSLPPPRARLPSGSRSTDDDDVASVTSDASSASSSTGKCLPLVPPKPRLRPTSSQPTSAAAAAAAAADGTVGEGAAVGEDAHPMSADVNAGLPQGQRYFSGVESPTLAAAAAGALARDSASSDDDVRNQLQSQQQQQQQQAPPVLRPRARPPEPPCDVGGVADGGSSAGGLKRRSLYEIVSKEGRRDDDTVGVQPPKALSSAAICQQDLRQQRYTEQKKHQAAAASMTCSACSSSACQLPASGECTIHAPLSMRQPPPQQQQQVPRLHQQQQQLQQQQPNPASPSAVARATTDFDFPLRLPPTRPPSMTLLQRQRVAGDPRSDSAAEVAALQLAPRSPVSLGDGANGESRSPNYTSAADDFATQFTGLHAAGPRVERQPGRAPWAAAAAAAGDDASDAPARRGACDGEAAPSWARSDSRTNESTSPRVIDGDCSVPDAAAAISDSAAAEGSARPRRRSATGGYMQSLLCSPTHERSRSLGHDGAAAATGTSRGRGASASDTSSDSGRESPTIIPQVGHRSWYKKMFKQMHTIENPGETSFKVLETIRAYEEGNITQRGESDINDNHVPTMDCQPGNYSDRAAAAAAPDDADDQCFADYGSGSDCGSGQSGGSLPSHSAYIRVQHGGDVPLTGFRKQLPVASKSPASPKSPPADSSALRSPPVTPETGYYREQTLLDRNTRDEQQARRRLIMEQVEAEEKRRKAEKEKLEQESRRHSDFFTRSAKMSITESRFDEFLASTPTRPPTKAAISYQTRMPVRALYSFAAENPKELTFQKNDVICLVKQLDKNWLVGELDGKVGIFPGSYVEACRNDEAGSTGREAEDTVRAKYNFKSSGGSELSLRRGDRVTLVKRVDANWYEARDSLGRRGIVPVSYLELPAEGKEKSPPNGIESPIVKSDNGVHGLTRRLAPTPYRALYDYDKRSADELELREGDIVTVVETCDDGWMIGYSWRTGGCGAFPGNYIRSAENGSLL